MRLRSIRIDDHCGTVTPVVSLPQVSVIVLRVEAAANRLADRRKRREPDARAGASDDQHLVVMPEHVLLLGEQVRHRVAGGHIRQEPERVLQVGQQANVGVRERWPACRA